MKNDKYDSESEKRCIVLANGDFPKSEKLLTLLRQTKDIIVCDGAVGKLLSFGLEPTSIVGDLDSLNPQLRERFQDRVHKVSDQETNDLTKAVYFAHQSDFTDVSILGATGLREDHTIGNISLLLEYAPLFNRIEMLTDFGRFLPILSSSVFACQKGQQISIFSLNPEAELSAEGLLYPIFHRRFTSWWEGTLNEAIGESFSLTLSANSRLILYFCDRP